VICILTLLLALAFKESRSGKLLRASREDETAAAAMGANIPLLRWQAFVLAAFIAGIGGALWGHFITSFAPKAFYLKETFFIISMLVIGGAGTVSGGRLVKHRIRRRKSSGLDRNSARACHDFGDGTKTQRTVCQPRNRHATTALTAQGSRR